MLPLLPGTCVHKEQVESKCTRANLMNKIQKYNKKQHLLCDWLKILNKDIMLRHTFCVYVWFDLMSFSALFFMLTNKIHFLYFIFISLIHFPTNQAAIDIMF